MPLRDTQELFYRCVRFDPAPAELEDVFAPSLRVSARDCMANYRNMYWYRLVDALFDVFPHIAEHLGRERFTRLVCRYLAAEPSRFAELERAGHALARFIETSDSDLAEPELVADIARLEYAALEVLLAPNAAASVSLAEIDAERLPFQSMILTPAFALVDVRDDALAVFDPHRRAPEQATPRSTALFWRRRFAVRHRVLDLDEAEALAAVWRGATTDEACRSFDSAERAAQVLRVWFDESLVVRLQESS